MDDEQQQVKASNPSACGSSTPVEGSFTWQGDQTVNFTPNAALEPGTYALQITDAAKSHQEQTLEPFDSSFTVATQDDPSSLPAPWQQETLGEGMGRASYDKINQAFTLSVEGDQSNHFVYQSLEGNGSLVARVSNLETIDQNGKAGLMLREGLQPSAPYVLLALTPQGVEFSSKGEDGTLTREAGSLQGPVWLKLERKEDRVYAYESEDGVKWTRVTTLSLALSSSLTVGLVVDGQDEGVQAQFEEVVVQQKPNDEKPIAQGSNVFDGVNPAGVSLPGDVTLEVGSGSLKAPTKLTLKLYEDRPAGRDPKFSPVGPRAVVEAPLEKFDLSNPNTNSLFLWVPATPDLKQDAHNILYEVSVTLGDGRDYVYFDQYGDNWAAKITPAILGSIFGKYPEPEVLKVSVQPVDSRGWYEEFAPNEDEESSGEAPTFSALSLSYEASKYLTGLYKIPFDVNFDLHCGSDVETMPSASSPASPPEGKTPLVLVHGWTLLNDFKTGDILGLNTVSEYPDSADAYAKKQFAPGLCYWSGFINNFLADSVGVPLDTLRQEYELYSFAYDSRKAISSNAQQFGAKLSGLNDAVIIAHSTGGLVTKAYMQGDGYKQNIRRVISAGTPYRGSRLNICVDADSLCDRAFIDPAIRQDVIVQAQAEPNGIPFVPATDPDNRITSVGIFNLQLLLLQFQGSKDLTWQNRSWDGAGIDIGEIDVADPIVQRPDFQPSMLNPYLDTLNQNSAFDALADKFTVFFGTSSGADELPMPRLTSAENGVRLVQLLMARGIGSTGHRSEELTTIQSACLGKAMNDCSASPFKGNLIYRPAQTHTDLINTPNMSSLTVELLRVAGRLHDIDDGTPNGNQRVYIGNADSEANECHATDTDGQSPYVGDGVCDDALENGTTKPLDLMRFDFGGEMPQPETTSGHTRWRRFGEDADANGRIGDGKVKGSAYEPHLDMSDFRRWRDWHLDITWKVDAPTYLGSPKHPKRDVNGDLGYVDSRVSTHCYAQQGRLLDIGCNFPRWADFNGDGKVTLDEIGCLSLA